MSETLIGSLIFFVPSLVLADFVKPEQSYFLRVEDDSLSHKCNRAYICCEISLEKEPGTWWNGQWEQWGLEKWLSEIDKSGLNLEDSDPGRSIVLYHEKNRDNCNLLRWDAYRIGCAVKMCEGGNIVNLFCLTNKP
ncbi:hypothetical protein Y032_0119g849 [Ancylostoma ceylanicum]|uniref:C-type lectin domain-containing protein n=1 Tax=Ancylostoma ceylanicum TaxID=53326 RepID=A0A016TBB6_9BILA|nr:hypothetical protein Y032_0119g849 [Ancylostoma ceylanicum]